MHQAGNVSATGNTIVNKHKHGALIDWGTQSQKCIATNSGKYSKSPQCSGIVQQEDIKATRETEESQRAVVFELKSTIEMTCLRR